MAEKQAKSINISRRQAHSKPAKKKKKKKPYKNQYLHPRPSERARQASQQRLLPAKPPPPHLFAITPISRPASNQHAQQHSQHPLSSIHLNLNQSIITNKHVPGRQPGPKADTQAGQAGQAGKGRQASHTGCTVLVRARGRSIYQGPAAASHMI